mmetsp:Transcript_157608/g.502162  ORF Transcript_157608/g.502162 Transcript_157608/m.502162 type:complete len:204 (+) Transcript_157608:2346-2957(+)
MEAGRGHISWRPSTSECRRNSAINSWVVVSAAKSTSCTSTPTAAPVATFENQLTSLGAKSCRRRAPSGCVRPRGAEPTVTTTSLGLRPRWAKASFESCRVSACTAWATECASTTPSMAFHKVGSKDSSGVGPEGANHEQARFHLSIVMMPKSPQLRVRLTYSQHSFVLTSTNWRSLSQWSLSHCISKTMSAAPAGSCITSRQP